MIFKILILALIIFVSSHAKSYENYKVYSVIPNTKDQVQVLKNLQKHGYQYWNDDFTVGTKVKVMVAPENNEEFVKYTKRLGIEVTLSFINVQELIDAQLKPAENIDRASLGSFSWNVYHSLDEIYTWLDELQETYPDIVRTVTIGTTIEGRPIKGVTIDFKYGNRGDNPLIGMIEGGIHPVEWISPATVTWIIKEFLTSTDSEVRSIAESFVWHIFPVVNPDGYAYTFTNNRLWRKNRNPANYVNCTTLGLEDNLDLQNLTTSGADDDLSRGIDLNRNFDYLWMTIGASPNPCDVTYGGPGPASEPEVQALQAYILQLKEQGNFLYYLAFHSFSQMVLIPYSHTTGQEVLQTKNYGDLFEIAARGIEKLTTLHGTRYTYGTAAAILYAVSGSSIDWVKGVTDIPIVLLFELRDNGEYGFLLPPQQIVPNCEEIMAFLVEMDKSTKMLGYYYSRASSMLTGILTLIVVSIFIGVF